MTYWYSRMRWYSVSEAMPIASFSGEYCLVACLTKQISIARYDGTAWLTSDGLVVPDVFAWAWLPHPPDEMCKTSFELTAEQTDKEFVAVPPT